MITLKTISWIVIIVIFAMIDYTVIKKGSRPNYILMFCVRGFVMITYLSLVWDTQYDIRTVNLMIFCLSSFWILFDILMGSMLHGDPFYICQNSGFIDRFALKNNWTNVAYWGLKILAAYLMIQTAINIYTKFA